MNRSLPHALTGDPLLTLLATTLVLVPACKPVQATLAPDLTQATKLVPIAHKTLSNDFDFGAYHVHKSPLETGIETGSGFGFKKKTSKSTKVRFELAGPTGDWKGSCQIAVKGEKVEISGGAGVTWTQRLNQQGGVVCSYTSGGEAWSLELVLTNGPSGKQTLEGEARSATATYTVRSEHGTASGKRRTTPVAYVFASEGTPKAAVQVTKTHQAWLPADVDSQPGLASTMAALLASTRTIETSIYGYN